MFLRHVATRDNIDAVFRAVQNEVSSATTGLMRPYSKCGMKRALVLVDRGGAPPPFVPVQYSVVPHHVVARAETVASIRAAFKRSGVGGAGTACAGAGAGAGAGAAAGGAAAGTPCSGSLRVVAVHSGGGTGKTTAAITYVAATREREYPGGIVWLCGESRYALELSMQQVYDQHLSASHKGALPRSEACDAMSQWLAYGQRGRWLVVIDNVDEVEEVLPRFMEMMRPSSAGDVLVTTRASGVRVLSTVPWAACVELGCLRASDAAVVVWRLVCAYNTQHGTHCGWHGCQPAAHSVQASAEPPPEVPSEVPRELQQLWLEARGEYTALVALAKGSERGFGGLPLALVAGTGALCTRGLFFSAFLGACEKAMVDYIVSNDGNTAMGKPPLSATQFLQRYKIGNDRAEAIVASLGGGGPVTLGDLSDVSDDIITSVTTGLLERQRFTEAVKAVRKMGPMVDNEVASRSQARQRLAGIWALSRAGLSPAAQELMDIIAYYPADCTMEEVLVWGSLPTTSSIARAFAEAESTSAPSSCKCKGCAAQRRRMVVASLVEALVGASLVKRHLVPGHMVFPLPSLVDDVVSPTANADDSKFQREFACLAVHRVVQEVVRRGHEGSPLRPVVLAWQAPLTCGDDDDIATGAATTEVTLCGGRWVPAVALRQIMAARHVAATAPHIGLSDAVHALKLSSNDGMSRGVRLMCRVCRLAVVLCDYSELHAALVICEWVGSETRRGSGLWHACMLDSQQECCTSIATCLGQLGRVYKQCSMYAHACVMLASSLAMRRRIHGSKDHSDVAVSLCSLAQVYKDQGRLDDSASLQEESLAMDRRIHGSKDHSDVAVLLSNLAQVYKAQGRLDDSASLQEESLAMYRLTHGSKDHSSVAASLCSLAQVYKAQGRLDDSASLQEESLAMCRRIHGSKDHSSVAVSLCSLAQVYLAQGRLDDSASLQEESLAMYRRIHGSKDHSDVAVSLCSLARVYLAQGRLDDSASLISV